MQTPTNSYIHDVLFRTLEEKEAMPQKFFWLAVCTAFLVANAPPAQISKIVLVLLQLVPENVTAKLLAQDKNPSQLADSIVTLIVIPIKKLLFFAAFLVITYPILKCVSRSKFFWYKLGLKKIFLLALSLFLVLSLFVFPYAYPYGLNSHPSGLSGTGIEFGRMSMAPFGQYDDLFSKRLLKPAIANFTHMDGYVRYYLFSLICTYFLIFLTVAFLESKLPVETNRRERNVKPLSPRLKWILYLSLMTSSFVLVNFQWPGLSEHLSFILILLMASIPMTPQARLATVALCTVNHEGSALVLLPIIFFCFPKEERVAAIAVMVLFYGIAAAGYGFSASKAFQGQGVVVERGSVWSTIFNHPVLFFAGLFFSYKLLWIPFVYAVWMLWNQRDKQTALAIGAITLFPILLTFVAWDTTRIGGFGWLGMLIAIGILMQNHIRLAKIPSYALALLIYANILIPSYNVVIYYQDSLSNYPYPGLYMIIDSAARSFLT
jgi:hypothetical protein